MSYYADLMGQSLVNADVGNIVDCAISGSLNLNGALITSSLVPSPTATYDLGSSSNYWRNLYVTGTSTGGAGIFTSLQDTGITGPANIFIDNTSTIRATVTPSNGQILIGTGVNPALNTITGTSHEIIVTNGSGSITLSTPQAIDTTSNVTFNNETLNGTLSVASGITATNLNTNAALYSNSSQVIQSSSTMTDGQILIGSSIGAPTASTISGTSNEVIVTNSHNSITLSLPQAIATTSSPTFSTVYSQIIAAEPSVNIFLLENTNSGGIVELYSNSGTYSMGYDNTNLDSTVTITSYYNTYDQWLAFRSKAGGHDTWYFNSSGGGLNIGDITDLTYVKSDYDLYINHGGNISLGSTNNTYQLDIGGTNGNINLQTSNPQIIFQQAGSTSKAKFFVVQPASTTIPNIFTFEDIGGSGNVVTDNYGYNLGGNNIVIQYPVLYDRLIIRNVTDSTKQIAFNVAGNTTGKVLTIATNSTTSQTLNTPNITSSDTIAVLGLAQTYTGGNTYSGNLTFSGNNSFSGTTGLNGNVTISATLSVSNTTNVSGSTGAISCQGGIYCKKDFSQILGGNMYLQNSGATNYSPFNFYEEWEDTTSNNWSYIYNSGGSTATFTNAVYFVRVGKQVCARWSSYTMSAEAQTGYFQYVVPSRFMPNDYIHTFCRMYNNSASGNITGFIIFNNAVPYSFQLFTSVTQANFGIVGTIGYSQFCWNYSIF